MGGNPGRKCGAGGVEMLFGFPITHSRYKQLGRGSFNLDINNISHLGYSYQAKIVPYGEGEVRDVRGVKESVAISGKAEEYLRKCIELCQKEGINIILVNSPMPTTPDEAQKKYNYVQQIADEYGVPFLNGVCFDEEMGLDWTVDSMGSDGHLNYHGATKYTKWLCDYMKSNYNLPDRRGDERFEVWSRESDKLKAVMRRDKIRRIVDFNECLDSIDAEGLYYVISLNGEYAKEDGKLVLETLQNHGIHTGQNGTYVINNGEQLFYSNGESGYKFYKYFDDSVLYVYEKENNHVIMWNGIEFVAVKNGINIFVYDELLDEVVGKIGLNADAGYEMVR